MSTCALSSRSIKGQFYRYLEQAEGVSWVDRVSMRFESNQGGETYAWLGQSPMMREWIGGRQAKGLSEHQMVISNRHFEATLAVMVHELRRDKTGQIMVRIRELAERTNAHWSSLLSTLIMEGEVGSCYDGHPFFSRVHQEGKSGRQSNLIEVDKRRLGLLEVEQSYGTKPGVKVMKASMLRGIEQLLSLTDDHGEPLNESAQCFLAMVPTSLMDVANAAISSPVLSGAETNDLATSRNFRLDYVVNARLPWNDRWVLFRTDGAVAPFIRQEEQPVELETIGEGSEEEFLQGRHLYGVDCWRNVGYGYWQKACLVKLV